MNEATRSLREIVAAEGALPLLPAAGWLARLGKTIDEMHRRGEVHGAISSDAVLVEDLSPLSSGRLLPAIQVAHAQAAAYRSPERGSEGAPSADDDRWAWSVFLAELLRGGLPQTPVVGRTGQELLGTEEQDALSVFLTTCWSVDPLARPPSAAALATAMDRLLDVAAPLPPLAFESASTTAAAGENASKPPSFGGGLLGLGAFVVLAGLAAAAFVGLSRRGEGKTLADADTEAPAGAIDPVRALALSQASAAPSFSSIPADAPELLGQGASTVEACVSAVVGVPVEGAFEGICGQRDALLALGVLREGIRGTAAQRTWDSLGWYDLAAVVGLQGRCCPLTAPPSLDTPPSCAVVEALTEVQDLAKLRRAAAAKRQPMPDTAAREEAAKVRFGAAATCALHGYSDTKKAHRASVSAAESRVFTEFFGKL